MKLMEALTWANATLKESHKELDPKTGTRLDSPMLDAELLLSHVLSVPKSWLFTHLNNDLNPEQTAEFQKTIERRALHEPIAYIIGKKAFYKRDFFVNRFVLIPRPATETLVEEALACAQESDPEKTIFTDVGTGSGAIAITLAAESRIPVIASDIDPEALRVAKHNAKEHGVEELVDFRQGDLLDPLLDIFRTLKSSGSRNPISHMVLCANLPYLTETQFESGQRDVRDFEPKTALTAGQDGLDAYWQLFRQLRRARNLLPLHLTVLIEIDPSQSETILPLIRHSFPEATPRITKDLEGHNRVVIAEL